VTRPVAILIGGAVLILVALLWVRGHDRWVRETALAQHSADSVQGAFAAERRAHRAERLADSLGAVARAAAADRAYLAARTSAEVATRAFNVLLDSLDAMAPDTLEMFLVRLRAGWAEAQRQQDSLLAAAESRVEERQARVDELEAEVAHTTAVCDAQMGETLKQLRASLARTSPSLLTRVVRAVPLVLATVGAWEVGKALAGH